MLLRCQSGEEAAYRELMGLYQQRVYRLAYGVLGSNADAMDATQEAFIKIFRNIREFRGDSQLYTWIYRIARNAAIDLQRRQKVRQGSEYKDERQTDDETEVTSSLPADQNAELPERTLRRKELSGRMEKAIGSLPAAQREIFLLRELEGLSYEELAQVLQISKGTVMSRLFLARKKLQQELQAYHAEWEEA